MILGIWYIYYDNPNYSWKSNVSSGLNIALPRLQNYLGGTWNYWFAEEFRTSINYQKAIMPTDCLKAIKELAISSPSFKTDYERADIPMFVFANCSDAFVINYMSPVFSSIKSFSDEATGNEVVIEHEIAHCLGLPDHMKPYTNPQYGDCIMGNVYLTQMQLCSECRPKFVLSNYKKTSYTKLTGIPIPEVPPEPENPTLPARWKVGDSFYISIMGWTPFEVEIIQVQYNVQFRDYEYQLQDLGTGTIWQDFYLQSQLEEWYSGPSLPPILPVAPDIPVYIMPVSTDVVQVDWKLIIISGLVGLAVFWIIKTEKTKL